MKNIRYIFVLMLCFPVFQGKAQCPTLSISNINNVSCYGGSDGSATVNITPDPGLPPCGSGYTIAWSNGANTTTINGLAAGIYYVYVTNNCTGCTSFALVTINEPYQLTSTVSVTDAPCFGQAGGSIDLTVSGGSPPYSFLWNNGATSEDLLNVGAGTYTVTITDGNGCLTNNIAVVNQPAEAISNTISTQNVSCFLGNDGAIDLTVWGGTPPYSFNWNSGVYLSEDLINVPAGNYNVQITDANGCVKTDNTAILQPTAITTSLQPYDVLCNGDATGNIDLTVSGGTPPYSYTWTSSQYTLGNIEDLSNIPADTYYVTVTDNNGCTQNDSTTVNEPPVLTLTYLTTDVSCNGYSDGAIDITVSGGTLPYSFAWSGTNQGSLSVTTEDLVNIQADIYTVTVTDGNGCMLSQTIEITQPPLPLSLSAIITDILCYGDNTGAIDISVNGGTIPYSFSWSNTQTTEDVGNLFVGTYSVTVTDTNGCIETGSYTVNQPAAPLSVTANITPVLCFGDSTGSIDLTPAGGTSPYSFSWVNSNYALSLVNEDVLNFPADTYAVTITDNHNCLLQDTFVISQPPALNLSFNITDVLCFGDNTGAIDLTVSGGVYPYAYLWNNGSITEDIQNIPAGTYTVTVTDDNLCTATDSVTVNQPLEALYSNYNSIPVTCHGGQDGQVFYSVLGGSPPYSYLWSNGDTINNLYNVTAGTYLSTVTDAHGCQLIENIVVTQPDLIGITENIIPVTCYGLSNGIIDITVSGGTPGYSYQWTNSTYVLSNLGQDLVNYPTDYYTVTVTDTNGCQNSASFFLPEPLPLTLTPEVTGVVCADDNNASIILNTSGGNPPYAYNWNTGASDSALIDIVAGNYTVTVNDSKNCSVSDTFNIIDPLSITIDALVKPPGCRAASDGEILLTPQGGNGGYSYLWNTNSTDNPLTGVKQDTYTVTVTDIMGCAVDTIIEVEANPRRCLDIPNAFTPDGDGINDTWQIGNITLFENASIQVFDSWGALVFKGGMLDEWNGTYMNNGKKMPSATYYYVITENSDAPPYTGGVSIIRNTK